MVNLHRTDFGQRLFWHLFAVQMQATVKPTAPDGGRQIVYQIVSRLLQADPHFLKSLRTQDLTIADPYQDYFVGLNDMASGHLLSAAKLGKWHYLLMHGTDAVGAVELNADEQHGKALRFDGFFSSNFSAETLKALHKAESLPQVNAEDYELRRLDSILPFRHGLASRENRRYYYSITSHFRKAEMPIKSIPRAKSSRFSS